MASLTSLHQFSTSSEHISLAGSKSCWQVEGDLAGSTLSGGFKCVQGRTEKVKKWPYIHMLQSLMFQSPPHLSHCNQTNRYKSNFRNKKWWRWRLLITCSSSKSMKGTCGSSNSVRRPDPCLHKKGKSSMAQVSFGWHSPRYALRRSLIGSGQRR